MNAMNGQKVRDNVKKKREAEGQRGKEECDRGLLSGEQV